MEEQKNIAENLASAEKKIQAWYDNEFVPYKQQKNKEKQDFTAFAKIIVNNTSEIKYMLANIYDNNSADVVKTWNALNIEPKITDIKLTGNNLIITDENGKQLSSDFNALLTNIEKILG